MCKPFLPQPNQRLKKWLKCSMNPPLYYCISQLGRYTYIPVVMCEGGKNIK